MEIALECFEATLLVLRRRDELKDGQIPGELQ